jgi:ribose transport system permease protein
MPDPDLQTLRLRETLPGNSATAVTSESLETPQGVGHAEASHYWWDRARAFLRHRARDVGVPLAVVVMIIFFSATSDVFLTAPNFRNIGLAAAALAAVSFGQTFTILTAGLDLSVGSTVSLVSIVAALGMRNQSIWAGILMGLAAGTAVGLVNGLVITRLRVVPFIATLAMLSIVSGLALNLSGGVAVSGVPTSFGNLAYQAAWGVPLPVVLALLVLIASHLMLRYSRLGRHIYAVGGNEEAARLSGININRAKVAAYVICGFCAAVGSIILTARVASGQPTLGTSLPLQSVAAVILGGVSLFGGRGSVLGVAFGVAFVSILSNGLNLLNVSSYTQLMVIGVALVVAVAIDEAVLRRRLRAY